MIFQPVGSAQGLLPPRGNETAVDVYREEPVGGSTVQRYRVEALVISNHLNYLYNLE